MQMMGWKVDALDHNDLTITMTCGHGNSIHIRIWTKNYVMVFSTVTVEQERQDDVLFMDIVENERLMKIARRELMYHEMKEYVQLVRYEKGNNH